MHPSSLPLPLDIQDPLYVGDRNFNNQIFGFPINANLTQIAAARKKSDCGINGKQY